MILRLQIVGKSRTGQLQFLSCIKTKDPCTYSLHSYSAKHWNTTEVWEQTTLKCPKQEYDFPFKSSGSIKGNFNAIFILKRAYAGSSIISFLKFNFLRMNRLFSSERRIRSSIPALKYETNPQKPFSLHITFKNGTELSEVIIKAMKRICILKIYSPNLVLKTLIVKAVCDIYDLPNKNNKTIWKPNCAIWLAST